MPVNIVTGDRDALQLSSSQTTVFLTQKGITNMAAMTPDAVFEKYHIEPRQVIDMTALMGDTADNIPGVPGIGEKTALKLITQYDNLNNLYAHVEEIKGAQGKKLTANKELAYLSYDLATIKRDVPLETSLEEMHQPVHFEEMRVLFQKLGINLRPQLFKIYCIAFNHTVFSCGFCLCSDKHNDKCGKSQYIQSSVSYIVGNDVRNSVRRIADRTFNLVLSCFIRLCFGGRIITDC